MTRADLAEAVRLCRAEGWLYTDIAAELGISRSHANALGADPDGSKTRLRNQRYGGRCVDCGKRTDGSSGRAKAAVRCASCARFDQTVTEHGTHAMYESHGCRCDVCRAANTERVRHWRATTTAPIPHGTANGYRNYGCRCDDCRAAHNVEWNEMRARLLAAGDYPHGTTGYTYGCRCDECRAAASAYRREYRERSAT